MSKRVKSLGLSSHLTELLIKHSLTSCKDILHRSNLELMLLLRISIQTANEIIHEASKAISPCYSNALQMSYQFDECLGSSLGVLDDLLSGGLRNGLITEIAGPPGCGKTQFCLMLAVVSVTLDVTGIKSILYFDTEGGFDVDRLTEIALHKYPEKYHDSKCLKSLMERVHVYRVKSFQELMIGFEKLEEEIIKYKCGLVIIDSIASLVRREFDAKIIGNIYERNKFLSKQASSLKFLASEYNFPVIVTNQITTQYNNNDISIHKNDIKPNVSDVDDVTDVCDSGNVVVALGVHWNHCINSRIIVQYSTLSPDLRELHLVKCPHAPYVKLFYTIEPSGIVLKSEGNYFMKDNFPQKVNTKSGLSL